MYGWTTKIWYIDEGSGEAHFVEHRNSHGLKPAHNAPHIPAHVVFRNKGEDNRLHSIHSEMVDGKPVWRSLLPTKRKVQRDPAVNKRPTPPTDEELREQEHFIRYLSATLTGVVSTEDKLKQVILDLEDLYTGGFRTRNKRIVDRSLGVQGLLRFTYDRRYPNTVTIRTSQHVARLLRMEGGASGTHLWTLGTHNVVHLCNIIESTRTVFLRELDYYNALRTAARCIDRVRELIKLGFELPTGCACTDESKSSTEHICRGCSKPTLCTLLGPDLHGNLLCQICLPIVAGGNVAKIVSESITRSTRAEGKAMERGATHAKVEKLVEANCADVLEQLEGYEPGYFKDQYTGADVKQSGIKSYSNLAVDAVHPAVLYDNELLWHAPSNLAIIQTFLNVAKKSDHVGVLQCIANYSRSSKNAAAKKRLTSTLDAMRLVTLRHQAPRSKRPRRVISKRRYAISQYENLVGRLLDATELSKAQRDGQRFLGLSVWDRKCQWTDAQRKTIVKIIREIAFKFKAADRIQFNPDDDCPWLLDLGQADERWNWDTFYAFCYGHHHLMEFDCNEHFETLEDTVTIACEFFYQILTTEKKYESLLGLPIVMAINHPLSPSFGKRNHGRQQRTGWCLSPTSLADRDDSLNNMLIETWFENRTKFNYSVEEWLEIQSKIASIQIPKKWYDPDTPLPAELVDQPMKDIDDTSVADEVIIVEAQDVEEAMFERFMAGQTAEEEEDQQIEQEEASSQVGVPAEAHNAAESPVDDDRAAQAYTEGLAAIRAKYLEELGTDPTSDQHRSKRVSVGAESFPPWRYIVAIDPYQRGDKWADEEIMKHFTKKINLLAERQGTVDFVWDLFTSGQFGSNIVAGQELRSMQEGKRDWPYMISPMAQKLFFIFHMSSTHFATVVLHPDLDTADGRVLVYDSIAHHNTVEQIGSITHQALMSIIDIFTKYPQSHWSHIAWQTPQLMPCPQQSNHDDCGFMTLNTCRKVVLGQKLDIVATDEASQLAHGRRLRLMFFSDLLFDIAGQRISEADLFDPSKEAVSAEQQPANGEDALMTDVDPPVTSTIEGAANAQSSAHRPADHSKTSESEISPSLRRAESVADRVAKLQGKSGASMARSKPPSRPAQRTIDTVIPDSESEGAQSDRISPVAHGKKVVVSKRRTQSQAEHKDGHDTEPEKLDLSYVPSDVTDSETERQVSTATVRQEDIAPRTRHHHRRPPAPREQLHKLLMHWYGIISARLMKLRTDKILKHRPLEAAALFRMSTDITTFLTSTETEDVVALSDSGYHLGNLSIHFDHIQERYERAIKLDGRKVAASKE